MDAVLYDAFKWIVSSVIALMVGAMKYIHGISAQTKNDLTAYKTYVAENYVSQRHHEQQMQAIDNLTKRIDLLIMKSNDQNKR